MSVEVAAAVSLSMGALEIAALHAALIQCAGRAERRCRDQDDLRKRSSADSVAFGSRHATLSLSLQPATAKRDVRRCVNAKARLSAAR